MQLLRTIKCSGNYLEYIEKGYSIMNSQAETALLELSGKFERMMDNIEIVKDKQEEMAVDIAKIRDAVYNPESGMYARVRDLETFKSQVSKVLWIIMTALVGLGLHQVLNSIG